MDHRVIGEGRRGPITKEIQDAFFDVIKRKTEDKYGWLFPVE